MTILTVLQSQYAQYNAFATWQRSGLLHVSARLGFILFWLGLSYYLMQLDKSWLWLTAYFSLYFSVGLYQRYRLISDTAESRLMSGAQGYVRLQGTVRLLDHEGFRGDPQLPATAWLAGFCESTPFILEASKQRCTIYPQHAEVVVRPADTHLYWLHAIYPGQQIYVLGDLRTYTGENLGITMQERLSRLLAEWKRHPQVLLEAYDQNGDGKLDEQEWEHIRQHARSVAQSDHDYESQQVELIIDRSSLGKKLLISNIPWDELAQRYRYMAWFHGLCWLSFMLLTQ